MSLGWGIAFAGLLIPILIFGGPVLVVVCAAASGRGGAAGAALVGIVILVLALGQFVLLKARHRAMVEDAEELSMPFSQPRQTHAVLLMKNWEHDRGNAGRPRGCDLLCSQILLNSPYRFATAEQGGSWLFYQLSTDSAVCGRPEQTESRIDLLKRGYAGRCVVALREPPGSDAPVVDFHHAEGHAMTNMQSAMELRERIDGKEEVLGRAAAYKYDSAARRAGLRRLWKTLAIKIEDNIPLSTDPVQAAADELVPLIEARTTREAAQSAFAFLLSAQGKKAPTAFRPALIRLLQSPDPEVNSSALYELGVVREASLDFAKPAIRGFIAGDDPLSKRAALSAFSIFKPDDIAFARSAVAEAVLEHSPADSRSAFLDVDLAKAVRRFGGGFEASIRDAAKRMPLSDPNLSAAKRAFLFALIAQGNGAERAEAIDVVTKLPEPPFSKTIIDLGNYLPILTDSNERAFWATQDAARLVRRMDEVADQDLRNFVAAFCRQYSFAELRGATQAQIEARIAAIKKSEPSEAPASDSLGFFLQTSPCFSEK